MTRKTLFGFSIRTALLALAIVGLAVSHGLTSRRLASALDEVRMYRSEYGHLVVEDPSRIHVIQLAKQSAPWKWRVSFPPGETYKLCLGVGPVPEGAVPERANLIHVIETQVVGTGQAQTAFVDVVDRDLDLLLQIGCDESQTVGKVIPKADAFSSSGFHVFFKASRMTFVGEPDEPFVLFHQVEDNAEPAVAPYGVVAWFEPRE